MFMPRFRGCLALAVLSLSNALPLAAETNPYGVCSHLTVNGYPYRDESCRWIAATGIGAVRTDFCWSFCQKTPDAELDFTRFDNVLESAERRGLRILPIVYLPPRWADPVYEHLPEFENYVFELVRHFGSRLPEIEIWNEWNIGHFWKNPNAKNYCQTLVTAYRAAKRANPSVRVLLGGTAGVPYAFIDLLYKNGGAGAFDVMNVHPYSHPNAPEGHLDVELEQLRELMSRYGDGDKDIVITEHGWPTHDFRLNAIDLQMGLKVACPETKSWNVILAETSAGSDGKPPQEMAEAVQDALPPGSVVTACFSEEIKKRLAAGGVDAVIYPFGETFPASAADAVYEYVKGGGTLVELGGAPFWFGRPEISPGQFGTGTEGDMREFERYHLGFCANWTGTNVPSVARAFPTAQAVAAGFRGDPAGERATRFQTRERLHPGDELIPTLVAKDKNGDELIASCVIRYNSELKGRLVVSGVPRAGAVSTNDENNQARYLVRSLAIALAEGVKEYFWYEFHSTESDPFYSEDHFGLMHVGFTPKPAWGAYRNFIQRRPAGSVNLPTKWHNEKRTFYCPQWKRPDGVCAGVMWKLGEEKRCTLKFSADGISFVDYTGRQMKPVRQEAGVYSLRLGRDPVFFSGGTLVQ